METLPPVPAFEAASRPDVDHDAVEAGEELDEPLALAVASTEG